MLWGDDNAEKGIWLKHILNPPGSRQKGVRNKRFKSIFEKKSDEIRRIKSKKLPSNGICVPKNAVNNVIVCNEQIDIIWMNTGFSDCEHVQ